MTQRAVRGGGRAREGVHLRGRRLPGRAVAALERARARSSRSRSTAACASSTPRRTCTSSSSTTSRSPARRRSRCVKVTGRRAEMRPIAGTRPRAAEPRGGPARAPRSCSSDEKERAEHVMLVDLGRNDLGRVCEFGSVEVERADDDRDLLARDAHRLVGVRARCGPSAARWTRCAPACRRARSRARRRSGRWRSSTSSSRRSAASTAARSAT